MARRAAPCGSGTAARSDPSHTAGDRRDGEERHAGRGPFAARWRPGDTTPSFVGWRQADALSITRHRDGVRRRERQRVCGRPVSNAGAAPRNGFERDVRRRAEELRCITDGRAVCGAQARADEPVLAFDDRCAAPTWHDEGAGRAVAVLHVNQQSIVNGAPFSVGIPKAAPLTMRSASIGTSTAPFAGYDHSSPGCSWSQGPARQREEYACATRASTQRCAGWTPQNKPAPVARRSSVEARRVCQSVTADRAPSRPLLRYSKPWMIARVRARSHWWARSASRCLPQDW